MADPQPSLELCFLAIDHWSTCMAKGEWSGWMQAIGSVGALLGIWYTVRKQRQLAEEADRRKEQMEGAAALNNARNVIAILSAVLEQTNEAAISENFTVLRLHRGRLIDCLQLAQTVKLEHLSLRHQAATLAGRQMAVTLTGCLDVLLEAPNDRARITALRNLQIVAADQVAKAKQHEEAIAARE